MMCLEVKMMEIDHTVLPLVLVASFVLLVFFFYYFLSAF